MARRRDKAAAPTSTTMVVPDWLVDRRGFTAWAGRAIVGILTGTRGVALRMISSVPWIAGGVRPMAIGTDRALQLIPFFACVRILADAIASLPVQTFRKLGEVRQPMSSDPQLIQQPCAVGTLFDWIHRAVVSIAMRGNAYGLIINRDGFGFPTQIEWLHPDDVYVDEYRPTLPEYYWLGKRVPRENIVHIPWFVLPGKVVGLSPVAAFANSIGIGLQAASYGQTWFTNGGQPPGTFRNSTRTVSAKDAEEISDRLTDRIRSGQPLVYGSDWEYKPLSVTPEESQFIETMKLNATQIASIFGIPPERVGGEIGSSLTYSTVEQNQLNFVTMTLRPWLVRLETVLSNLLPERQFIRFNIDALVRADLKTRYEAHHLALSDGWKTKDEIRALEDLPPLPAELKEKPPAPVPPPMQPPPATGAPPAEGGAVPPPPVNGKVPATAGTGGG